MLELHSHARAPTPVITTGNIEGPLRPLLREVRPAAPHAHPCDGLMNKPRGLDRVEFRASRSYSPGAQRDEICLAATAPRLHTPIER